MMIFFSSLHINCFYRLDDQKPGSHCIYVQYIISQCVHVKLHFFCLLVFGIYFSHVMYLDSICDSDLEFFSYIESFPFNYCVLDSVTLYKVMLLFVDSVTLYKVMLLIDLPCINSII